MIGLSGGERTSTISFAILTWYRIHHGQTDGHFATALFYRATLNSIPWVKICEKFESFNLAKLSKLSKIWCVKIIVTQRIDL